MRIGFRLEQGLTQPLPKEPAIHGRQVNSSTGLRALSRGGLERWKAGGDHVSVKSTVGREENEHLMNTSPGGPFTSIMRWVLLGS